MYIVIVLINIKKKKIFMFKKKKFILKKKVKKIGKPINIHINK